MTNEESSMASQAVSQPVDGLVRIPCHLGGETFEFHLSRKRICLGIQSEVDFFSLDGSDLRRGTGSRAWGGRNGAAVLGCWWTSILASGREPSLDDRRHLLLAAAHCQLGSRRNIQSVYRCSYLPRGADRETELSPQDRARLHSLASAGDARVVTLELERLFLSGLPAGDDLRLCSRGCELWLSWGIEAWKAQADNGLQAWLQRIDRSVRRLQKRGTEKYSVDGSDALAVRFTKMFTYECFIRFQCCCADLWAMALLPELRKRFNLGHAAARFMNLMHGVHLPAYTLSEDRGLLCGQALSLHPIGRWILGRPEYLAAFGAWVSHPQFDLLDGSPRMLSCAEYQKMIMVLLCASHEYHRAWETYEARRNRGALADNAGRTAILGRSSTSPRAEQSHDCGPQISALFRSLAEVRNSTHCHCGLVREYVSHDCNGNPKVVLVRFSCRDRHTIEIEFPACQVIAAVANAS